MKHRSGIRLFLYVLLSGQGMLLAAAVDPNQVKLDPNTASQAAAEPIAGTLGMGWLYQGKKPPQPLVGQSDVTFRIERYPWPYTGYFWDHGYWGQDYYAGPWFYAPWYRHYYWRYCSNDYWRHHGYDYGRHDWHNYGWRYNDAYTYPLNYVEMQMKLNDNISIFLGVSYISDPVPWP